MAQPSASRSSAARAIAILGFGLVLLAAGIGVWLWQGERIAGAVTSSGEALVGGRFELVDQNGVARTDADFEGQYTLIYFGYTFCPDVCPTSLAIMSAALEELGTMADRVTPIFITVDPQRDTVEQLQDYARHFHPRLVALTGSEDQVAAAARAYRVYYGKAADDGDDETYLMDHSSITYVMGPDGRYITHFSHGTGIADMAEGLSKVLGGEG